MKLQSKRLNFDLHCHSWFSADGVADPEEMIVEAKRKGLSGFAITDHNTCACVDYFLEKGYMNKEGTPVDDFLIIPGQEITTREGHLLALGISLPDLKGIPAAEAVEWVHRAGGLAVPAHPYDFFRAGIRESVLDTLEIDALEVFNAATSFKRANARALAYAKERNLPMTAGSDAHECMVLGTAYTILEPEPFSVKGVLQAVLHNTEILEGYLKPKDALRKTWNNLFRLKRKKHRLLR